MRDGLMAVGTRYRQSRASRIRKEERLVGKITVLCVSVCNMHDTDQHATENTGWLMYAVRMLHAKLR